MALRDYQVEIEPDTLYEVRATSRGSEQLKPNIEIIGGTADVYAAQTNPTEAAAPTGMQVLSNGSGIVGTFGFEYIPSYLYVSTASGTITSVVLSGIEAVEVVDP